MTVSILANDTFQTNQQLFPGPGITKASLAALTSSNLLAENTNTNDLQSQLEQEQTRARQLFIAVIALASAAGLLLLSLIGSCVFGKKSSESSKKDVVYWGKDEEPGQGHTYSIPYDGATKLKLGGYAPVKA